MTTPKTRSIDTRSIDLLGHTFETPQLHAGALALHEDMDEEAQIIRSGEVPQPPVRASVPVRGFLGRLGLCEERLVPSKPRVLSPEERYKRMMDMLDRYDEYTVLIHAMEPQYQRFLLDVAQCVQALAWRKSEEMRAMEARRLARMRRAIELEDEEVVRGCVIDEADMQQLIRQLGAAVLLSLRKLDLFSQSLSALLEEQEGQASMLTKLKARLELRCEEYRFRQDLNQHRREIEQMAQFARDLEHHIADSLGPLYGFIDEVQAVDRRLAGTIEEIRALTEQLDQGQRALESSEVEDELIDFLIKSQLKSATLDDALNALSAQEVELEVEWQTSWSVREDAATHEMLANITTLVDAQLGRMKQAFGCGTPELSSEATTHPEEIVEEPAEIVEEPAEIVKEPAEIDEWAEAFAQLERDAANVER